MLNAARQDIEIHMVKTTLVEDRRAMSTWILQKPD
jgi:hypothetical protein